MIVTANYAYKVYESVNDVYMKQQQWKFKITKRSLQVYYVTIKEIKIGILRKQETLTLLFESNYGGFLKFWFVVA